jgi:hypothetical protein
MTTKAETSDFIPEMAKEDVAWLMNALWESLQAPGWTFGNRKDLEKLGEAIFSGKKLKEVDDKLLTRLFPHLKTITLHLGNMLMRHEPKTQAPKAEAQAPSQPETTPKQTETT